MVSASVWSTATWDTARWGITSTSSSDMFTLILTQLKNAPVPKFDDVLGQLKQNPQITVKTIHKGGYKRGIYKAGVYKQNADQVISEPFHSIMEAFKKA